MPAGSVSTSGIVGMALGEIVTVEDGAGLVSLQLSSNEKDRKTIKGMMREAFNADSSL